jgi:hypothetical protein
VRRAIARDPAGAADTAPRTGTVMSPCLTLIARRWHEQRADARNPLIEQLVLHKAQILLSPRRPLEDVKEEAMKMQRMCMRRVARVLLTAGAVLSLAVAAPVRADDNLLVNGGFEDLDFTGWMLDESSGFTLVQCDPGTFVAEGACAAFLGTAGNVGTLSQSFATLAGHNYHLSFAFLWDGSPLSFVAAIDDVPRFTRLDPPALDDFRTANILFRAAGPTSTLSFAFQDDPGFITLDAVAVAVPEPASAALLGLGLAGLALARRRKRAA